MRILFLSPRQCWPVRSGAKLREYHFLRALGLHCDVIYAYFADPDSAPLTRNDLPFCREVIAVPKPPSYGPAQILKGVIGPWPLPVLNYISPEMTKCIARLLAKSSYDLVHLDSIHMMRYRDILGQRSTAKIVYNWHNIESEAMRRYAETVKSLPHQWYARRTARKLEQCEREILCTAMGHIVCSEREHRQLLQWSPNARIATTDNGVDVPYFARCTSEEASPRNLVFVGSMDYFPNTDAMTSFSNAIWPRIRQKLPDSRLLIVGANPSPAVQALAQLPGVSVTGTVPDVRPFYQDALAAVVPLRTGSGTRLKILEAMAAGVPVISTPLGAEGLDVSPSRNILIAEADAADQWIGHLLGLADTSNGLRSQLSVTALDLVKTRYDWQVLGESLWNTYQNWLGS